MRASAQIYKDRFNIAEEERQAFSLWLHVWQIAPEIKRLKFDVMKNITKYIGPGFIVAATGIGAGDIIVSSVAGARYGVVILWAAILGGVLKYVINEGIARWQLATDTTLLEGWIAKLPKAVSIYFFLYLVFWAIVVGGTLIFLLRLGGPYHLSDANGRSHIRIDLGHYPFHHCCDSGLVWQIQYVGKHHEGFYWCDVFDCNNQCYKG